LGWASITEVGKGLLDWAKHSHGTVKWNVSYLPQKEIPFAVAVPRKMLFCFTLFPLKNFQFVPHFLSISVFRTNAGNFLHHFHP
jgi:hypothetical protein